MPDHRRVRLELADSSPPPPSHALRPFVVLGVKEVPLPRTKPKAVVISDVAAAFSSPVANLHSGGNSAASTMFTNAIAAAESGGAGTGGGLEGEEGAESQVCTEGNA